jgi:phosphate transport system substrate-binding protein
MILSVRKMLLGIVFTAMVQVGHAAEVADVAIVVNRDNPVDELSLKELRSLFELQQQFWKTGSRNRVALVTLKAGLPEKELILEKVYHRTEEALNRDWMLRVFKAEIVSSPVVRASSAEVIKEISRLKSGIGFIDASMKDPSVKVLRIDGRLPGEPGYVLRAGKEN